MDENFSDNKSELVVGSYLQEIPQIVLEGLKFKIGDEVEVYVTGEPIALTDNTFYIHRHSKVGVVDAIGIDPDRNIVYRVKEFSIGINLNETNKYVEMETNDLYGKIAIFEGFLKKISFNELKLHLFKSVLESDNFRNRGRREGTKTLSNSILLEMQMAFYEYGKTGIFPPEWERLANSIIETTPNLYGNLLKR